MNAPLVNPDALVILRRTPAALSLLLEGISAVTLRRTNPEGWSVKDIVAHLVDTEVIAFRERVQRMLDEDVPLIEPIDPAARLAEGDLVRRTLADLLAALTTTRAGHVEWLTALTQEELSRPGRHTEVGAITPATLIHQWAYHDLAHLRQILEMLQTPLTPGMANMRGFYPEAEALFAQLPS